MKYLLPNTPYFKANLHTHTTISDGKLSPAETKAAYKEKGYSILSLTDHNVIVDHSELNDPDFLMLTGMEINVNAPADVAIAAKTYHLNMIAKRPENRWCPSKPTHANALQYKESMQCEEMDLSYNTEAVNALIARANEMGFLVSYNHPTWSNQSYPDYAPIQGLWAMEMRNSECICIGGNENNPRVFKDMLNLGNRIYPLGTDDMHTPRALGQSWIMVGAPQLEYTTVMEALEKGDFYMSCGPVISSLTVEENTLKIVCSDAKSITMETFGGRFSRRVVAEDGALLQGAEFDLAPLFEKAGNAPAPYIYLTVNAPDGTYAATRAYTFEEIK